MIATIFEYSVSARHCDKGFRHIIIGPTSEETEVREIKELVWGHPANKWQNQAIDYRAHVLDSYVIIPLYMVIILFDFFKG